MQVIYALEELPKSITKSIFLAGPTPRDEHGKPWRQDALKILEDKKYDGVVFIPEPRNAVWHKEYDRQIDWEDTCLNVADCILFWVPRELKHMPGFNTNIEWGRWENSGKLILGYPKEAEKMPYIDKYAKKERVSVFETLVEALQAAMDMVSNGAERTGGDRYVPLFIWHTPHFQKWYAAQTAVGNRIEAAKLCYNFRLRNKFVFLWILQVNIYVKAEDRIKERDIVLSRNDIATVMLWRPDINFFRLRTIQQQLDESEVILIREYRPSVSNQDCFIRELPGGSTFDATQSYSSVAAEEVSEETGFKIEESRLKFHGARQCFGTLSAHKAHTFSVELTDKELLWFKENQNTVHGNVSDGERTYIEVVSLQDIYKNNLVDWGTLGMISTVVNAKRLS